MKQTARLALACVMGLLTVAALIGGTRSSARVGVEPGAVVINEVAWGGTAASSADEWIELRNTTAATISLSGWQLVDGNDLAIALDGEIPSHGYYLIERTDDDAVSDIAADWTGSFGYGLSNSGETLTLTDGANVVIDTANGDGGDWPAGTASNGAVTYATMERIDPTAPDSDENWCTNDGLTRNGADADGDPINGTPKAQNSCYQPPPGELADLIVAKTGPLTATPGHVITYRITLSNTGAITATDVHVTDALPSSVSFITQVSPFTFSQPGMLVWDVGTLVNGAQYTVTVTGRVTGSTSARLTNRVTATTDSAESETENNHDQWTISLATGPMTHLPLILRAYTPPPYGVIIEAALYDGLQTNDYDEAVLLGNGSYEAADLSGWELCKWRDSDWICAALPTVEIAPKERLWLARSEAYFAMSFGFAPDHVLSSWPRFTNTGDEVVLRDADGRVRDALVYEDGLSTIDGWTGATVAPYAGTNFAEEGQILHRVLNEATGFPSGDTDAAVDWAQHEGNPETGRRVRYPGWDLEQFFQPAVGTTGTVTASIAPDNAYDLVVETIRAAEESIALEAYTLEHYGVVTELVQQAQRGVSVTVLLEGGPVGGVEDQELWACQQLHATDHGRCYFMVNSDTLKLYDRYTFMHAKFMIVDEERLLLGSQNLTPGSLAGDERSNGTGGSRGVTLVTDAPAMVERAMAVFEADCNPDHHNDISMWGPDNVLGYGAPPPDFAPQQIGDWTTYTVQFSQTLVATGDRFELFTAPEAALRRSDALLGLLEQADAGDAIYVEQLYEYADWGNPTNAPNLRLQAYLDAARRGARVRILLNGGDFDIAGLSLARNIEAAAYINAIAQDEGLDLNAHLGDPTDYGIHNKMVLVDLGAEGQYAHVGSINGSETSNKVNREMAIQIRSPALFDYLYAMFDYDWRHQPPEGHLLISEVLYNPDGQDAGREWIELYNPTTEDVDLSGWYLGDVGPGGEYGSGLYRFPNGATLVAEGMIVVAHQAADVTFTPDYEFLIDPNRDNPSVPNMTPAGSWDGFGLALGNSGDEVLLLDADGAPVDVVVYGDGSYPGVTPHPGVSDQGHSLERRPPREDTNDCSQDFFDRYPPTPGDLPE